MKKELNSVPSRTIDPIDVSSITSLDHFFQIARAGKVIKASLDGFTLHVNRTDLVPKNLKQSLSLMPIEGQRVMLHLPQLNIEIAGRISQTQLIGKKGFEIIIDYTNDAPEYWRECLLDLLPAPGEFD